jgi:hypothetical protein
MPNKNSASPPKTCKNSIIRPPDDNVPDNLKILRLHRHQSTKLLS